MGKCRKPLCNEPMTQGSAYCAEHKAMPNIVLPPAPMAMLVRQATHQGLPTPIIGPTRHRRTAATELPTSLPHHRRTGAVVALAVPAPHHRRSAALSSAPQANSAPTTEGGRQFYGQKQRQMAALQRRQASPAYMEKLLSAFFAVRMSSGFDKCMDDEVGKWNRNALADRLLRALAPPMAMRPMLEDVCTTLRALALSAAASDRVFAEGYYTELAVCCDAMIEKQDISFIFSQATSLLGPLLAPLAAAGSAATGLAPKVISATKSAVQAGIKKGVQAALVDTPSTLPGLPAPHVGLSMIPGMKSTTTTDPMRFTLAWMAYVTGATDPAVASAVQAIHAEFGGRGALEAVHAFLKANNV